MVVEHIIMLTKIISIIIYDTCQISLIEFDLISAFTEPIELIYVIYFETSLNLKL